MPRSSDPSSPESRWNGGVVAAERSSLPDLISKTSKYRCFFAASGRCRRTTSVTRLTLPPPPIHELKKMLDDGITEIRAGAFVLTLIPFGAFSNCPPEGRPGRVASVTFSRRCESEITRSRGAAKISSNNKVSRL